MGMLGGSEELTVNRVDRIEPSSGRFSGRLLRRNLSVSEALTGFWIVSAVC